MKYIYTHVLIPIPKELIKRMRGIKVYLTENANYLIDKKKLYID